MTFDDLPQDASRVAVLKIALAIFNFEPPFAASSRACTAFYNWLELSMTGTISSAVLVMVLALTATLMPTAWSTSRTTSTTMLAIWMYDVASIYSTFRRHKLLAITSDVNPVMPIGFLGNIEMISWHLKSHFDHFNAIWREMLRKMSSYFIVRWLCAEFLS